MENFFHNKSVIIIGATGGLGSSFAKAFSKSGAKLLLVGRNEQKLEKLTSEIAGDTTISTLEITDEQSVRSLADFSFEWSEKIDIVVNASGCDVRKSLFDHTYDEIHSSLEINLLGAILITEAFFRIF